MCLEIPKDYRRYNTLVGSNNNNKTAEEIKEEQKDLKKFSTGFFYGKKYHKIEYVPDKLSDSAFFFEHAQDDNFITNDCLVHAVNFALRFPWFTCREQIERLINTKSKKGQATSIERKAKGGVSVNIFKDFVVKENNLAISVDPNPVFTMTMPKQFNIESIMAQMKNEDPYSKQYEELINFITDAMINKGNHRELILVGTGMGNVPFTHACTFILREIKYKEISKTYIAYLDC